MKRVCPNVPCVFVVGDGCSSSSSSHGVRYLRLLSTAKGYSYFMCARTYHTLARAHVVPVCYCFLFFLRYPLLLLLHLNCVRRTFLLLGVYTRARPFIAVFPSRGQRRPQCALFIKWLFILYRVCHKRLTRLFLLLPFPRS